MNAHPCTSGDDILAGEDVFCPPVRGQRGTRVEFVAIGGDDQRIDGVGFMGDQCNAHRDGISAGFRKD